MAFLPIHLSIYCLVEYSNVYKKYFLNTRKQIYIICIWQVYSQCTLGSDDTFVVD